MKAEWTNSDSLTTSQTTKAILVIDKPKSCADCELADFGRCWGTSSYVHMRFDDIPVTCPLKPLPEKKEIITDLPQLTDSVSGKIAIAFIKGYNACIKEILGETE